MAGISNPNTPEMIARSKKLYGGMAPGAGRTGQDYTPPPAGTPRTPHPAFYQDVPGAPPAAPPPSNYLPRPAAAAGAPQSPFTPQDTAYMNQQGIDPNAGLRASVAAMHDQNAAIAARNASGLGLTGPSATATNPSPIGRVPSPPNMIGNLGLTAPPPAAQPLGGYAANQAGFDQRMKAENPNGLFGGTLPVRGADGRVTFADGPMKDLGQKPQFGKDSGASYRFTGKETGEIDPVTGKMGMQYIGNNTPEQQKAREVFDARRGGLEARKAAYESRTASSMSDRKAGVLANAQARKEGRAEKVRIQKGRLTFDERLAMQDPQSAALKADANGRLGLAREQGAARIAAQKDTLAAQERMATANNASREKIAGLGLAKANGTDANGKPIDNRTDAQKIKEAPSPSDIQGMTVAEQEKALDGLPKETKERIIREANKPGLISQIESTPFLGDIAGGLAGDTISAYMNPHGLAAGLLGVQQKPTVNARTSQITNDQLKDQPGDRPGVLRAKADMRKKRGL